MNVAGEILKPGLALHRHNYIFTFKGDGMVNILGVEMVLFLFLSVYLHIIYGVISYRIMPTYRWQFSLRVYEQHANPTATKGVCFCLMAQKKIN